MAAAGRGASSESRRAGSGAGPAPRPSQDGACLAPKDSEHHLFENWVSYPGREVLGSLAAQPGVARAEAASKPRYVNSLAPGPTRVSRGGVGEQQTIVAGPHQSGGLTSLQGPLATAAVYKLGRVTARQRRRHLSPLTLTHHSPGTHADTHHSHSHSASNPLIIFTNALIR